MREVHQEDGLAVTTTTDHESKAILAEIKKARGRIHHFKQWKNEPGYRKKLGRWRRRLAKAIRLAGQHKVDIPRDPFLPPPPPPPPPTEEELHEIALAEARSRVSLEWQACTGKPYWAPWGNSGWSAVVLTELSRVWCRASRVNPRTGEVTTEQGRVRRDRLVQRDPALGGKDRPAGSPKEIVPPPAPAESVEPEPEDPVPKPGVERTPERQVEIDATTKKLLELLDDGSTINDW